MHHPSRTATAERRRPRRLAVYIHGQRQQLQRCRLVARVSPPVILLPVLVILFQQADTPLHAMLCGWLSLSMFALGLFLILTREADAQCRLERAAEFRMLRSRRRRYA